MKRKKINYKKIALFGPSGFLGPSILEQYPEILAVGRTPPPKYVKNNFINLPNFDSMKILDKYDFDRVIFLIGNSNHYMLNKNPLSLSLEYNCIPLQKALTYFCKRKIKKFISFSGALIYGNKNLDLPVKEDHKIEKFQNNYLFSKYVAEEISTHFRNQVPTINVRLSNIYGPTKLTRPDVIHSLMKKTFDKTPITVWNKSPQRDFLYTKDAAEAITKLLFTDYVGNVNLGSGKLRSVKDVCKIISKLSNKPIKDLKKTVNGQGKFVFDISFINQLTGWEPKYSLEDGLKATYERMKLWAPFFAKKK